MQISIWWASAIGLYSLLQSKEEVMAVRLREADSMAAVAEMRQRVAELEIQVRGEWPVGVFFRHKWNKGQQRVASEKKKQMLLH